MPESVDYQALRDSHKALSVMFILAILAANAILLVKLLRRAGSRLLQFPHLYVLAALAIGDILVALFTLVVKAREVYEDDYSVNQKCETSQVSWAYVSVNAFVFSCGVIVLVLEMWLLRRAASIPAVLTSLVAGFLPYLAGLIVVLPIAFADFNWDTCKFDLPDIDILRDRIRASAALTYLVFPVLALAAATALKTCHKTAGGGQVMYTGSNQPAVVMSSPYKSYSETPHGPQEGQMNSPHGQPNSQPSGFQPYPPQGQPHPPQGHPYPPQGHPYPPQGQPYPPQGQPYYSQGQSYPPQVQPYHHQGQPYPPQGQPYPPQGQPYPLHGQSCVPPPQAQAYGQPSAPAVFPPPGQTYAFQPYTPAVSSPPRAQGTAGDVVRQKSVLITVSALAVVFYIPYGIFMLGYVLNTNKTVLDPVPEVALMNFVVWFTFLRPVITPLVYALL